MNRDTFDITPKYGLLQDVCAALARNARELLRLAGEPVTSASIMIIVKGLPHDVSEFADERWKRSELNGMLEKAFRRSRGGSNEAAYREVFDYFIRYIPSRSYSSLDTLESAFRGVLGNFPEETETGIDIISEAVTPRIEFQCANCNRPFNVSFQHAGKKGKCKGCGAMVTIPEAP